MAFDDFPGDEVTHTVAAYDSKCPYCGERIYEGDPITKVDGEWVHRTDWEDM